MHFTQFRPWENQNEKLLLLYLFRNANAHLYLDKYQSGSDYFEVSISLCWQLSFHALSTALDSDDPESRSTYLLIIIYLMLFRCTFSFFWYLYNWLEQRNVAIRCKFLPNLSWVVFVGLGERAVEGPTRVSDRQDGHRDDSRTRNLIWNWYSYRKLSMSWKRMRVHGKMLNW